MHHARKDGGNLHYSKTDSPPLLVALTAFSSISFNFTWIFIFQTTQIARASRVGVVPMRTNMSLAEINTRCTTL